MNFTESSSFWTKLFPTVHSAQYSGTWAVKLIHFSRGGKAEARQRQRRRRRLLLNLWRNFDGGSLASTPVWMIYTLILQSFTLSFVNFLSKIWFFLQSSRTARKWNQFLSIYCSVRKLITSHSSLVVYLQMYIIGHLRPELKFPAQIDFGFSQIHISHQMLIQLTLIKRQVV